MSYSLNAATIIGNVGQDPDVRTTNGGNKVANFTVATSESWKAKDGEKKTETTWHRVSVFGPLVDIVEKFVRKGLRVYVRGRINTRKWTDAHGVEKSSVEIVLNGPGSEFLMLDSKSDTPRPANPAPAAAPKRQAPAPDLDDDIPF